MEDNAGSGNSVFASPAAVVENGTSAVNGTSDKHSHHHKDKHRDRDRDKDRHRSDKEKHRSSSSSSHKDKDRDKERHRDKDKVHKSSSSHSSSRDKEHSSSRDKEHKSSSSHSSSRDKDHKSSSSHSSSRDKEKDKDKHSSSSSRDKDRDKDKDRHSSSSGHKSSHRDKDRDKEKHRSSHRDEKDRHRSSSDKDHNRSKEKEEEKAKQKEVEVKEEAEVKVERDEEEEQSAEDSAVDDSVGEDPLQIKEEPSTVEEDDEEDETPLTMRETSLKREAEEDDEEDVPLFARAKKIKKLETKKSKKRRRDDSDEEEEEFKPKPKAQTKKPVKTETGSPTKRGKKQEEEPEVWKWWEEKKRDDGTKWQFLEHKGPVFAPEYEPLPSSVKFSYDGKEMKLSQDAEEVATFYAKMLSHDYTSKEAFNTNFMKDWRKCMTEKERAIIKDLSKCNFNKMHEYFNQKSEERKAMTKEEKLKIKQENEELVKIYGFCTIDGHKEKIGNFRIEPPGLFRGRGEHPKMGMLKRRVMPQDVIINCSKDSKIPKAPDGYKWKKVQHDNTVTWLASWTENVQGNVKYVMLNPSSKLKGEKDMLKYETARKLAKKIDKIRETYIQDWKSKEMRIRQRAVALYFIDRLALRAGNEKDEDQADTVGCCSLRVEHVTLKDQLNGKECVVVFDFLGKDSIRYYNEVPVEKRVYKNLKLFVENKKPGDDLFDRLNTMVLNKHLNELMDGLSAKVFRTYNASITLQNQLNELTKDDYSIPEKVLAYNRANRAVAILCNHQRSVPKSHEKSMEGLKSKIEAKRDAVDEAKKEYKSAKRSGDSAESQKAQKKLERLKEQLMKLEVQETDKEENKTIALGTSKLNYLDPRISVAWCKKHDVPIEKIYNKTQRDKFRWAIDMAGPDYVF